MFNKKEIGEHYDEFNFLYENWSGKINGGYHFGIANKLSDIFKNDQMVYNLSYYFIHLIKFNKLKKINILDAGCGVGDVAQLTKMIYPSAVVTGITISDNQVNLSKKKFSNSKIKILYGDFEKTNFNGKTFDVIYFIDSICHGNDDDKKKALTESYRLLKPGGQLLICDVFLQKNKAQWSKWFNYINNIVINLWRVNEWSIERKMGSY
jgi:ubiquinone/menaquinone biosynthesis C-methylase UbiE